MKGSLSTLCLAVLLSSSVYASDEVKLSPKINYAESLLINSKVAKRMEGMESEEVQQALEEARGLLDQAKVAYLGGDKAEANTLSSSALKKFTEAAKLLPKSESAQKVLRSRYADLTVEISSYLEWYDTATYVSGDEQEAIDRVKVGMSEAKELFDNNRYEKANKILTGILDEVVDISNRSMTSSEIVNSLDFETPEEEQKYELARNNEYKRLIPIAEDQQAPKGGKLMLFKRFVKKAEGIRGQADVEIENNEIENSIKTLQASTDQYLKALRMIGIR